MLDNALLHTRRIHVRPTGSQLRIGLGGVWVFAIAVLSAGALVDHLPRFFQGDSIAYLSTTGSVLGLWLSHALLLGASGNHRVSLVVQLGVLMAVLVASLPFFELTVRRGLLAYAITYLTASRSVLAGILKRDGFTVLVEQRAGLRRRQSVDHRQ